MESPEEAGQALQDSWDLWVCGCAFLIKKRVQGRDMKNGWFVLLIFFLGCKATPENKHVGFSKVVAPLSLLNAVAAAEVISEDRKEGFFEKVGITDMLIQMKRPYEDSLERDDLLMEYKAFLKTEVLDFTEKEAAFCREIFGEIYPQIQAVHPDIYPKDLQLIKLKGNHYGAGAFYTREQAILIPQGALQDPDRAFFYETMLHEIFHIYSRYHPEKRKALYELIGFKKLDIPNGLSMDPVLKNSILINPDGIDLAYTIELEEDGKPLFAVPILAANSLGFDKNKPEFFDYLNFNLYPIQPPYSGTIKVLSQNDGSSRLDLKKVKGFYEQIQKNTDYIIHPDEILADNFIFLIRAKEDARTLGKFTEEGIELIEEMGKIIER